MAVTPKRRVRKVSLDFMGEEWKEAFVCFHYLTWEDSKRQREREASARESGDDYASIDLMREVVMENFVQGSLIDENDQLVEADAEAVGSLDVDALGTLYLRLLGVPDPKA